MVENLGNAVGYTGARTHRPLPSATEKGYRGTHQPQEPKAATTFDWDWNKAACTGCQTTVAKSSLVEGACRSCRGEPEPRANDAQPPLEHSKSGDQVYEPYATADLDTRYRPEAPLPDDDTEPEPAPQDPSPVVELRPDLAEVAEPSAPSRRPLTDVDLLEESIDHAARTLRAAHGIDDPIVGSLRTSLLSAIAALDFYLVVHCSTRTAHTDPRGTDDIPPAVGVASQATQPVSTGLGGEQPAAEPLGEEGQRPARFQTFKRPRRTGVVRRPAVQVDESAVVLEYAAGDTAPTIARRHGVLPKRIRQVLTAHHVQLRDDRAGNSGRRPVEDDAEMNAQVAHLYVEQGLATLDVAHQLHIGRKRVTRILAVLGIDLRPAAHLGHPDLNEADAAHAVELYLAGQSLADIGARYGVRAATIRGFVAAAGHPIRAKGASALIAERLRDLDVTAAQVKDWALATGLLQARPAGLVSRALVEAYVAAQDPALTEGTNPPTHPSGDNA